MMNDLEENDDDISNRLRTVSLASPEHKRTRSVTSPTKTTTSTSSASNQRQHTIPQNTKYISLSSLTIPNSTQLQSNIPFPTGMVLSPFASMDQSSLFLKPADMTNATCSHCGIIDNVHNEREGPNHSRCCICRGWNKKLVDEEDNGDMQHLQYYNDYEWRAHDAIAEPLYTNYCFIVDLNDIQGNYNGLYIVLDKWLASFPSYNRISLFLLAYSSTIDLYDLTEEGDFISCNCIPTAPLPSYDEFTMIYNAEEHVHSDDDTLTELVIEKFLNVIKAIKETAHEEPCLSNKRCTGAAIETACRKLHGIKRQNEYLDMISNIIVYSTGGINNDSIEYYQRISCMMAENNISLYMLCIGADLFNTATMQELHTSCAGQILFFSSLTDDIEQSRLARTLNLISKRTVGINATLRLSFSSCLQITRVVGACGKDYSSKSRFSSKKHDLVTHMELSLFSCTKDDTITIYYSLCEEIPAKFVYFQVEIIYDKIDDDFIIHDVCKVYHCTVATSSNENRIISSIDSDTIVSLIAKYMWLLSKTERLENAQSSIRSIISDVCKKYGNKRVINNHVIENDIDIYELPESLERLCMILYQYHYSPFMQDYGISSDEKHVSGQLLLRSKVTTCTQLLFPSLSSFNSCGDFTDLYLINLSLDSNRILYFDCFTHIVIWSGHNVCEEKFDVFRDVCLSQAHISSKNRFPQPIILSVGERNSQARWLTAKLRPAHQDPIELYPHLVKSIHHDYLQVLIEKFLPTVELSYFQFIHRITRDIYVNE